MDLHTHSVASGHGTTQTIAELAKTACARGIHVLGISDHGPATPGSCRESYFRSLKTAPHKRCGITILYGACLLYTSVSSADAAAFHFYQNVVISHFRDGELFYLIVL